MQITLSEVRTLANSFTDWESTCLAHHGIKGQKWGIRRFQNEDGTLTAAGRAHYGMSEGGSRRMSKQYNKQLKKLNRLQQRTDMDLQRQKAAQYDKRAKTGLKIAGAGAAIAGAGAAAEYGGSNLRNKLVSQALKASRESQWNAKQLNDEEYRDDWLFWDNQRKNLNDTSFTERGKEAWNKRYDVRQQQGYEKWKRDDEYLESVGKAERKNINSKAALASQIHKGVMAAGAAVAVTGAGIAAYNKIQSHLAKKRLTDAGHQKAVDKYRKQYSKMMDKFANTPYSELIQKQQKKNNAVKSARR